MNTVTRTAPRLAWPIGMAGCLSVALLLSACAGQATRPMAANDCADPADHEIKVIFDAQGCPSAVEVDLSSRCTPTDPMCVKVPWSKPMIRWRSQPAGTRFGVFFDPLVGPQYIAANGCLRKKINPNVPPVPGDTIEYKYTIASITSGISLDPNCKALDPKVIIDH